MIDFTDLNRVRNNYTDVDYQILTEVKNIVDAIIPVRECWVDAHTQKWALVFVFDRELEVYDVEMINNSIPNLTKHLVKKELLFTTKSGFKSAYFELINKQ